MLRLAVTTRSETYDRMGEPLAARGVEVVPVRAAARTIPLTGDPFPDVDLGFVFPPRVMEGGVLDAFLAVPWVNGREAVLRSRNKAAVLARLAAAGVPVPETVLVSNPVDESTAMEVFRSFDPPVVVKPNSTTRGAGITRVGDLDSFLGVLDYVDLVHDFRATADRSFLVQEFVADARDVRVMVVDGTVVGAVERRAGSGDDAAGQWKHNVHRGGEAVETSLTPDQRALAERTAAVLDLAYLGVDLLVTDDRVLVTETNARPTIDDEKYDPGFWDALADLIRRTAEPGESPDGA